MAFSIGTQHTENSMYHTVVSDVLVNVRQEPRPLAQFSRPLHDVGALACILQR